MEEMVRMELWSLRAALAEVPYHDASVYIQIKRNSADGLIAPVAMEIIDSKSGDQMTVPIAVEGREPGEFCDFWHRTRGIICMKEDKVLFGPKVGEQALLDQRTALKLHDAINAMLDVATRFEVKDATGRTILIRCSSLSAYDAYWIGIDNSTLHLSDEMMRDLSDALIEFSNSGKLPPDTAVYIDRCTQI